MGKLLKWIRPYIFIFIIICALQIVVPITYSYVPQFEKYIFDNILSGQVTENTLPLFVLNFFDTFRDNSLLQGVLVVVISLTIYQILRGLLMLVNGLLKGLFAEGISLRARNQMYSLYQDLPFGYYSTVDTGDYIQRCTSDIDTIKAFLSGQLPEILYIITSFISGALQMSSININIMFVTLGVMPINIISSIIYLKFVRKKFEYVEEVEANMISCVEENVNGARVVKAFAKEKEEIAKFDEKNKKYRDEVKHLNTAMALYWGLGDFFCFLQYAVTIGYCIYLAEKGLVGLGDIVVCLSYIGMLIYPIRSLGRIIGDFGKSIVAAKRIDDIISKDTEYIINGDLKPDIKGAITFDNVHFKFDSSDHELFKGVSFNIEEGETVAIVGKTGSGKSTVCHLLDRLLEYTDGHILIDGVELKDIDKKHIRNNIGLILQDPFLYNKSVYENAKIGVDNASEEDVFSACKTAHVHEDILNFDKKYQTLVGEKGVTLSGGQKQRLSIARTIIMDKPIVIFDDSLSAVDTKTDKEIRNSLLKGKKKTTIIITHRITTAKEANKIIVLNNGVVSHIGTHEYLVKNDELYASLWNIQGALEEEFTKLVNAEVK